MVWVHIVHLSQSIQSIHSEREHNIPQHFNRAWREKHQFGYEGAGVTKFRKLMREKLYNVKRKSKKYASD